MPKSIFITGAGSGIGRETARLFASKGWFVGAGDRDEVALRSLAGELGQEACATFLMDVTDEASVTRALESFARHTGGRMDVLHNNAGVLRVGAFETLGMAEHRAIIEVNVIGMMAVLHGAFPYLKATPGAQVVNMSSASAAYGIPDFASYSASKHGVRAMTEALDIEWEPHDIRVGDLMPPFVDTGMVRDNRAGSSLFASLGVNLEPAQIAQAVWDQVQSPRLHRPVSAQFRILWPVTRSAPATVVRKILKKLRGG